LDAARSAFSRGSGVLALLVKPCVASDLDAFLGSLLVGGREEETESQ